MALLPLVLRGASAVVPAPAARADAISTPDAVVTASGVERCE